MIFFTCRPEISIFGIREIFLLILTIRLLLLRLKLRGNFSHTFRDILKEIISYVFSYSSKHLSLVPHPSFNKANGKMLEHVQIKRQACICARIKNNLKNFTRIFRPFYIDFDYHETYRSFHRKKRDYPVKFTKLPPSVHDKR